MRKFKRYERYKDSGIEWIGEIPEEWEVLKIKRLSRVKRGASPRPIDDPIYFDDDGEFSWVRISDVTSSKMYLNKSMEKLSDLGASLSVKLNPGQLFISICATVGKPCITKIKCCIHDGFVYFPDFIGDNRFLYYIFEVGEAYKGLGKLGTQLNLNTDTVGNIAIGLPPINEQKAIANFLDQKTSGIDALISDKEKLIELLQEKRQAIITEAVTKGLNPNVGMKDSGVEWIGEIPEHWEVTKLKYITNQIIDGTHSTPQYTDDGIPFLRVTDITNSRKSPINLNEVKYISEQEHRELIKRCNPKKGDLLVSKNGTIGIPKVIDWDYEFSIFVSLCLIKVNRKVDVYYCSYYFESNFINNQIAFAGKTNTITNLHLDKIREFILPLPPVEEQKIIVNYLNNRTDEIDSLIDDIQEQIQKLKEYRQSLIFEAVTGKIDVRDYNIIN